MKKSYSPVKKSFKENKTIKALSAAVLLGMCVNASYAAETPTAEQPNAINTSYTPSYTLENTETVNNTTVTKYTYDTETGEVSSQNYKVQLTKTEYGEGANSREFNISGPTVSSDGKIYYDSPDARVENYSNSSSINLDGYKFLDTSVNDASWAVGGAVRNEGSLGNINSEFYNNGVYSDTTARGGAIFNTSEIKDISGNFINSTSSGQVYTTGGAISNSGTIGNVVGDFINAISTGNSTSEGGAIYNENRIESITGNFINNFAEGRYTIGGAIANYSGNSNVYIGDITGDFIGNHTSNSRGGAIYNGYDGNNPYMAEIKSITGDFIGNGIQSNGLAGGAIYNSRKIGDINGSFINNYLSDGTSMGGAIYNGDSNKASIGNINGNFIGNKITNSTFASGAAIYNAWEIGDITGSFINNTVECTSTVEGGAIRNGHYSSTAKIGNIIGDFVNNSITAVGFASGAAIYNIEEIGDITGSFIGNTVTALMPEGSSGSSTVEGGAIRNGYYSKSAKIGDIEGNFINNKIVCDGYASGAAIYNIAEIGDITGSFIGNSINAKGTVEGGALRNGSYSGNASIGKINGSFINNSIETNDYAAGAAIYNTSTMGDIEGDFIGNSISNKTTIEGGALFNRGSITNIKGKFEDNSITSTVGTVKGGAIYTSGNIIEKIEGDFVGNSATTTNAAAQGGAIYASSKISELEGNFLGNSVSGTSYAAGGAIYSLPKIDSITGRFEGNTVTSDSTQTAEGGAIYSYSLGTISGDLIDNHVVTKGHAHGGAIYSNAIDSYTGSLIGNSATSEDYNAEGGAIWSYNVMGGKITDIKDNFVETDKGFAYGGAIYGGYSGEITGEISGNHATTQVKTAEGGAIYQSAATCGNITDAIIKNNYVEAGEYGRGGAISNHTGMQNISGTFSNNSAKATLNAEGGFLYNTGGVKEVNGTFASNKVEAGEYALGGAINNISTISKISGTFVGNSAVSENANANGGAIFNSGTIGVIEDGQPKDSIVNASFLNNHVEAQNGYASGGAIYTNRNIEIVANDAETPSVFSGNHAVSGGVKDENAIFVDYRKTSATNPDTNVLEYTINNTELNFRAENEGTIVMDDKISGYQTEGSKYTLDENYEPVWLDNDVQRYTVNIKGDDTANFYLNNNIENAPNVNLSDVNLHITKREDVLDGVRLTWNSGLINMINNQVGISHLGSMILNGEVNSTSDVNLVKEEMDRFTADSYTVADGAVLNVTKLNLLNDSEKPEVKILYADKEIANNVKYTGENPVYYTGKNPIAYSPIYKYNLGYIVDPEDERGYFTFSRGGTSHSASDFNPAVLVTPTANVAAGQATVNETFKYIFEHADAFTQLPSMDRLARIKQNQYALSTDFNQNMSTQIPEFSNTAGWFRPYVTFEKMDLRNGPSVNATTYGSLVGFDSNFQNMKNGWTGITTGYIGYNGSQLSYRGVDTTMNGGLLGVTQTFYKGNFWTALTASAGASVGQSTTMYGKEDFTSLLAGVGSKSGYNFEFKEGKFIIQPVWFMSYTFVNTFDYTNAAGVRISSDPSHSMILNPSVRFIGNLKHEFQPYVSVGMVWNVMNVSNATANGVKLPETSIKPYVEYGLGLQKRFKDRYTAFGQAMIRNGGRNGIALTFGFRWNLGKDPAKVENKTNKKISTNTPIVQPQGQKVVLKQMSQAQRVACGARPQNTTRTTNVAVVRQLY